MTDSLFLRAARGEKTDRPPIWLMRQAGRYLPEYRALRQGITMVEAFSNPDLAIEITLQPIRRFGFDAAILFSDLTVPFAAMGAKFDVVDGKGPVLESPVRTPEAIRDLRRINTRDEVPFVVEAIRGLKKELSVPLIGFTGAPFTMASYLVEGGPSKDLSRVKALMYSDPESWDHLTKLLVDVIVNYLSAQVEAGADALQIFDSWVGYIGPSVYRAHLLPYMKDLLTRINKLGVPIIHFGTGNPLLLPLIAEAGDGILGVDYRISLDDTAKLTGPRILQGNLDPSILCSTPEVIQREAKKIVEMGKQLPGHIFNLGHGIMPQTPIENVQALLDAVRGSA